MTESAARDLAKRGGTGPRRAPQVGVGREDSRRSRWRPRAAATLQQRSARKTAPNVVAKLPGTNDQQAVVFTSHWDHFGMREPQPGEAKDADRIFNGAYDNASGCAGLIELARAMARAPRKAWARSMLLRLHDRRGVGAAGLRILRRAPADSARADGREPQRRRPQLPWRRRKDMVQLGADRSTLGPMVEGHPRSSAAARLGQDHASGARLLLPLGSLPAGQGGRARVVDQRAEGVHRAQRGGAAEEAGGRTTARTTTSRATSTIRRGTSAARWTT